MDTFVVSHVVKGNRHRKPLWHAFRLGNNHVTGAGNTAENAIRDLKEQERRHKRAGRVL